MQVIKCFVFSPLSFLLCLLVTDRNKWAAQVSLNVALSSKDSVWMCVVTIITAKVCSAAFYIVSKNEKILDGECIEALNHVQSL